VVAITEEFPTFPIARFHLGRGVIRFRQEDIDDYLRLAEEKRQPETLEYITR
jgi:hypothetical protein